MKKLLTLTALAFALTTAAQAQRNAQPVNTNPVQAAAYVATAGGAAIPGTPCRWFLVGSPAVFMWQKAPEFGILNVGGQSYEARCRVWVRNDPGTVSNGQQQK